METITGYSKYRISKSGQVINQQTKRVIRPFMRSGYWAVKIASDIGTRRNLRVHRLMAQAFIPPFSGDVVDHINRDPLDNRLNNLRWASFSENLYNRGAVYHACKCECGHAVLSIKR